MIDCIAIVTLCVDPFFSTAIPIWVWISLSRGPSSCPSWESTKNPKTARPSPFFQDLKNLTHLKLLLIKKFQIISNSFLYGFSQTSVFFFPVDEMNFSEMSVSSDQMFWSGISGITPVKMKLSELIRSRQVTTANFESERNDKHSA